MTTYKCLLYEVKDAVATLTLNRPERLNALGDTLRDDLLDAVLRASGDSDVRAIVITGAGKGFCSGGDVKAMHDAKERGACVASSRRSRRPATACSWPCGTRRSRSSPRSTGRRRARA